MTGLGARPEADTFFLETLVDMALAGEIRVPTFQRGLRWTRRDVVLLFESVLEGYPIGSLLLWRKQATSEMVHLGPLSIEAPAGEAHYVVDGQQRITALVCALVRAGHDDARFAVGLDLREGKITPRPARANDLWVPAHILYDLSDLLAWFHGRPDLSEHFERATVVSRTLRQLRLPAYVVQHEDESVLRDIFDRMNNAGKRLSRGEVFAALHRSDATSPTGTWDFISREVSDRTGFGDIDESLAMKLVLVRRGPDVMREIRNEFEPRARGRDDFAASETREEAYRRTADAAVRAVDFLQRVAHVPHLSFLPYQHLMVALVRFFAHHPEPSARHERLLRRFFWRAAVGGLDIGRGDTTGVGRIFNRAVVPDSEVASVQSLLARTSGLTETRPRVDPFLTNTAATKTLLCAMWHHGPRYPAGLGDGEMVDQLVPISEMHRMLGGDLTPARAVVPMTRGSRAGEHEKDAGNRLLLPVEGSSDVDAAAALIASAPATRGSHLFDDQDVADLAGGHDDLVVRRRGDRLDILLQDFLSRMCEWGQEDSVDLLQLAALAEPERA